MISVNLFYAVFLFTVSTGLIVAQENSTNEEIVYIEYKDYEQNVTRVINSFEVPDYSVLQKSTAGSNIYLLYTRSNPDRAQRLIANNASSITASNYNSTAQTVVVVHGWGGDQNSRINKAVRDAFLGVMNANVIVLDWSKVSTSNYATASLGVPVVGRALGQFLAFLGNTTGAKFNNMHLVGFSLGAHVVGNAGDYLGGQVARITGLDPAGPYFGAYNAKRLVSSNAMYVEAIHTDRGVLGTKLQSGDVDFYPNSGSFQPGCLIDACSHSRSWQLFAATVSYDHLVGRKCSGNVTVALNICYGDYLHMGNTNLTKTGNGMYSLKTDKVYPYNQVY